MSNESDAAVGRLAVMDGALNQLLREIVTEIGVKSGDSKEGSGGSALGRQEPPCAFFKGDDGVA